MSLTPYDRTWDWMSILMTKDLNSYLYYLIVGDWLRIEWMLVRDVVDLLST